MIDIKINITNKIANAIGTPFIVCGNSDYTVTFTFDAEWGAYQEKTARFFFVADGIEQYIDVLFSGNTCNAPVLPNIEKVLIGVYTGNLRTTTGAEVRCKRSILFGGKVHEPPTTEDIYNEILEIVSKKLGSEGGTVTGDYTYNGNTFIHEGNLELVEPKINEVLASEKLVETATGSAITIDSANAPLQNLKLFGKTTQDGTPTPTEPKELKSVGDSGSFEVGVYGRNVLNVTATTQTINGVTFTVNADKSITISGSATAKISYSLTGFFSNTFKGFVLNGCPNGDLSTYYFHIDYGATSGTWIASQTCAGEETILNTSSAIMNVYIIVNSGVTVNATVYPMLREATETDTTYEPYKAKQSITLTDTLRGIGEEADEKDFARGVKIQRFNVVDLSTLTWNYGTYWRSLNLREVIDIDTLSPKFLATNYKVQSWYAERNGAVMCIDDYGGICVFNTDAQTTPTGTLIYKLKTPIETPITEQELNAYRQLYTNKPNTTILSEATAEVDYYINKPNAQAIGNIHSQVNKDYFKLQQAIISTGGN